MREKMKKHEVLIEHISIDLIIIDLNACLSAMS